MTRHLAALLALAPLLLSAASAQAQSCQEIRFRPGASSGTITGEGGNDGVCFTFASGAGQTARLHLGGPETMCLTVRDVGDCQHDFTWRTEARSYTLYVSQMFRTDPVAPFKLSLSIQ